MMLKSSMALLQCVAVTMARSRSVVVAVRRLGDRPPRPLSCDGMVVVTFHGRTEKS